MGLLLDVRHTPVGLTCVCHGPLGGACPLLSGCGCALFDAAEGVVFGLDLDDDANRAVLARYRELRPDLPIFVITTTEAAARWSGELDGTTVATREHEIAALVARVDQ